MSYEVLRASDAPDYTEGRDPGHRFLGYGGLGSEQVSMNVITLDPGATHKVPGMPDSTGHRHDGIDEIYIVVEGECTLKLGDDEVTLGPLDAVRIPPETMRATRNTGDARTIVVMLSPKMTDPQGQSHFEEGFWTSAREPTGS